MEPYFPADSDLRLLVNSTVSAILVFLEGGDHRTVCSSKGVLEVKLPFLTPEKTKERGKLLPSSWEELFLIISG